MSETSFQLPYTDHVDRLPVSTKCAPCTAKAKEANPEAKSSPVITDQEFIVITPYADGVDPMELLKLAKRLVICKQCGTLRLID
jgi:hypothetical protein